MKKILDYIRKKLSLKVSLGVVFFAAIIFNIALGFFFYQSRDAVRQEAVNRAMQTLDKISLRGGYPEQGRGGIEYCQMAGDATS